MQDIKYVCPVVVLTMHLHHGNMDSILSDNQTCDAVFSIHPELLCILKLKLLNKYWHITNISHKWKNSSFRYVICNM